MNVTKISSTIFSAAIGISLATFSATSNANHEPGHNQAPAQARDAYWQAPDWSGFSRPPAGFRQAPPAQAQFNNLAPAAPVAPQRPPRVQPGYQPRPYAPRPAPPHNFNRAYPPQPPQAQPGGPYQGQYRGPSAFNTPGYNPHRQNRNRRSNNKFWGRSGPSSWMNPNKNNMERGWDDMMNSPSRMGEMPGGWTAPEVTMPNPVDMGDQMQDNAKDLPEQMRNMDVGNDVQN